MPPAPQDLCWLAGLLSCVPSSQEEEEEEEEGEEGEEGEGELADV